VRHMEHITPFLEAHRRAQEARRDFYWVCAQPGITNDRVQRATLRFVELDERAIRMALGG